MNSSRDNPEKHFISLPLLPSELAAEGGMVEADLPIDKEVDSNTEYEDNFVVPQVCVADVGSEVDGGYSSHSTCSSCPMDNQSVEQMEYVQQRDQQPTDSDWCEYDSCCIPGNSEVDDILYHFDQFFRGQVDQAIREFQERMGSILNEQQIHIRQIIAKALRSHHSQGQEQVAERDPSDICQPPFKISRISSEVWEAISPYLPASMTNQSSSSDANQMDSRGDKSSTKDSCVEDASSSTTIKPSSEGDMKHKLIIQLLTLTNNVSAMLLKPEYRS